MRSLRRCGAGPALAWLVLAWLVMTAPVTAQALLPAGFFDQVPARGGQARIEADMLAYDGRQSVISAEGDVLMAYEGYELRGERLRYNQANNAVVLEGDVRILDPTGTRYKMARVEVTGGLKEAFIESLTLRTPDGAMVTARDVAYSRELEAILTDAQYSPCGLCIDQKGRRIGWKVHASKIIYDRDNAVVYLEGPSIEILGVPVAWVPWLVLPDPSQPRRQGFRLPSFDFDPAYGVRANLPYFIPVHESMDLLLTPTLLSRQGLLMAAEWTHRVPMGEYRFRASGLHQLDPAAFAGTVGDRSWRGALQTTGRFTPLEDWTMGWSYTAFSDAAYLGDYEGRHDGHVVNEVYATHLSRDSYLDMRLQQFALLGETVTGPQQARQARAVPNIRGSHHVDLGEMGRVELTARLLGVQRDADSTASFGGVPYVFAHEENKVHAMVEAAWQKQVILPAGVLATPFLGLRGDIAHHDGASSLPGAPPAQFLLEATPIAAMDFRWPLVARNGLDTHLLEPIAQLVYRGSETTLPGITNDDAHSFVFDDTNLFSYNRFTGIDRQETGLRANIGGRYLARFEDGGWLELIGGQSYHLAGTNALGIVDHVQTGNMTGLGGPASYIVLGARGAPARGLTFGAKAQLDPDTLSLRRAALGADLAVDEYRFGAEYFYLPASPALGLTTDQHEVTGRVSGPLPFDYWSASASLSWDLASNSWLEATGRVTYDDGYFVAGGFGRLTGPTHEDPDDLTVGVEFKLRGPAGEFSF